MHREKIQFLAKVYISQEYFIRCEIYASREDLIPCKILCIARRSHPSQNFIHREKISSLAKFAHRGKIFMPCKQSYTARKGIVYLKGNIYPSTSTDVKCRGEKLSVDTVKDTVSHLNSIFKLTSFVLVFVEIIQKDEFFLKKKLV